MNQNSDDNRRPDWAETGYVLTDRLFVATPYPISEADYEGLIHRVDDLYAIIELEESYSVLIGNYVSLEKAHNDTVVGFMVAFPSTRIDYERRRREVDRHLVNFLASGVMYTEKLDRMLKQRQRALKEGGRPFLDAALSKVKNTITEQRDRLIGFRSLKAIRNHVLHRSLPIEGWRHSNSWVSYEGRELHRSTFAVMFRISSMSGKSGFDQRTITDLMARADVDGRIEWLPIVRECVEGASYVHKAARDSLERLELECLSAIENAINEYRSSKPGSSEAEGPVVVAKVAPSWGLVDERAINFDYQELVADLRRVNQAPIANLHRRQVLA
jgi:hypothetical protein